MDSPPKGVSKGVGRRRLVQRESLLAQLDRLEGEPRQAPKFARVWTPGTQLKVDFYTSREAARLAGMTPRERAQRGSPGRLESQQRLSQDGRAKPRHEVLC